MNLDSPIYVAIEVTSACNLSCIHCYSDSGLKIEEGLTTLELKKILRDSNKMKVFMVVFGGGEPFLREDIFELIQYSKELGLWVSIATNGTLLSRKVVEKLKEIKFHGCIQVSIHGATPETHDNFVGKRGSFSSAIRGMKNLKENDLLFTATTTPTLQNYYEIPKIAEMVFELGARRYLLINLLPVGRGKNIMHFDLSEEQWQELLKFSFSNEDIILGLQGKLHMVPLEYIEYIVSDFADIDWNYIGCKAGITRCFILPNGDVIPCSYLRKERFINGNVKKESLIDIWRNPKSFEEFRKFSLSQIKGKCKNCQLVSLCLGGCRASAYSVCSDLYAPDSRCSYQPLLHLKVRENSTTKERK